MFKHLLIYTSAQSYFSVDNTFFKKTLFDLIFSEKSQQEKSVLILQVSRAFTFFSSILLLLPGHMLSMMAGWMPNRDAETKSLNRDCPG